MTAGNPRSEITGGHRPPLQQTTLPLTYRRNPMLREINGILRQTNLPNESEEYLLKRDELRRAEIDLRKQRERVAELRRRLPQGPAAEDYVFEEVSGKLDAGDTPIQKTRLSELFTGPDRSVVIYHFMFGKKQTKPCPM